jgi:zinc transport system substrate-binding protein
MKKLLIQFFTFVFLSTIPATSVSANRLTVIATVFPLFDFAKEVGGPEANVRMLLPAGVEPHSWEPRPSDIVAVSKADVFLYVSQTMEPWAHNIVQAVRGKNITFVEAMDSFGFSHDDERHGPSDVVEVGSSHGSDPHFWLNLSLSARTVKMIGLLFANKDPVNADRYTARARIYSRQLEELDRIFSAGLEKCRNRRFVTGGHSAFGYLAERYNLIQISLYGVSPDSEPTSAHLASVAATMRRENLDVVFFEEMVNPRLAQVLASEIGASTRVLSPAGNLTAEAMKQGISFIQVMEKNLQSLREGLYCD